MSWYYLCVIWGVFSICVTNYITINLVFQKKVHKKSDLLERLEVSPMSEHGHFDKGNDFWFCDKWTISSSAHT